MQVSKLEELISEEIMLMRKEHMEKLEIKANIIQIQHG